MVPATAVGIRFFHLTHSLSFSLSTNQRLRPPDPPDPPSNRSHGCFPNCHLPLLQCRHLVLLASRQRPQRGLYFVVEEDFEQIVAWLLETSFNVDLVLQLAPDASFRVPTCQSQQNKRGCARVILPNASVVFTRNITPGGFSTKYFVPASLNSNDLLSHVSVQDERPIGRQKKTRNGDACHAGTDDPANRCRTAVSPELCLSVSTPGWCHESVQTFGKGCGFHNTKCRLEEFGRPS